MYLWGKVNSVNCTLQTTQLHILETPKKLHQEEGTQSGWAPQTMSYTPFGVLGSFFGEAQTEKSCTPDQNHCKYQELPLPTSLKQLECFNNEVVTTES